MTLNKETYDKLPEELKSQFTLDGDNYTNGEAVPEDVSGLKSALAKEKEAKVKAAQERDAIKAEQDKAIEKARQEALAEAKKSGDWETLEKDYQKRLKESKDEIKALQALNETHMTSGIHQKAVAEISKIFVAPEAMQHYANSRLKTTVIGDQVVTRVLDKNGNETAASLDDLKNEIMADDSMKSILVASQAQGAGAQRAMESNVSATTSANDLSDSELVARLEAKGYGKEAF